MDENLYQSPTDERPAERRANFAVSPNEPNGFDLIALMFEVAAAAVISRGYYRHFFPPPNVRWYGGMELIEPMFHSFLLASVAVLVAIGGRYRTANWVICGFIVLVTAAAILTDFL
jgi:hypothetical protein